MSTSTGRKAIGSGRSRYSWYERLKTRGEESTVVYYESIKRELNKRLIFDSRCDARLIYTPRMHDNLVVYYEPLKRALKTKSI